jgi:hypothetical protein
MKNIYLIVALAISTIAVYAQPIPAESLYLGQTPPGNTPKKFNLAARKSSFVTERIAISPNGKEIAFEQIGAGELTYYKFSGNKWSDTIALFQKSGSPAYSTDGNKLYFVQDGVTEYSDRINSGWSEPVKFSSKISYWHYLQATISGNFYAAMNNANGKIGGMDWSRLKISKTDTIITSLGLPINSTGDDMDFYIARDESFIILASSKGLCISYRKPDDTWTNPKSLGNIINFAGYVWGPFISSDNKYLFYSHVKADNSDANTYWVKIDNTIDSLKHTNFVPYVKTKLVNQTDTLGHSYSLTIPDSTFIDDDGNNTLTYTATLNNGNPLPTWLPFNPVTKTFSGTPITVGSVSIKVTATDIAKASVSATFTLKVVGNPANWIQQTFKENIQVFPNPTKDKITVSFGSLQYKTAVVELTDISGKLISTDTYHNLSIATIDLIGNPKGIYILNLSIDDINYNKKISIE